MDMVPDEAARAALPPVLHAVSRELLALGDMGAGLQAAFSSLTLAHARMTGEEHAPSCEDIQALDLFTQRLFVLAEFLTALAPTVTPGSEADLSHALSAVNLADVARRLGTEEGGAAEEGAEPETDPGDFELFGDDP